MLEKSEIVEMCMRLAKHKKDNKELLHYLLFEAQNLSTYIERVTAEIDEQFSTLNRSNLYLANKGLRKMLRKINSNIKYSASKQCEVELLLHFCKKMKTSGLKIHQSASISNLYFAQLKKVEKAMAKLHEDLQFDYRQTLESLM